MQMMIQCPNCRKTFRGDINADQVVCTECGRPMARSAQISQILEAWYYPRRWFRDVAKPNLNYLLEMLWTAEGQGEKLYAAVAPPNTNYNVFVHQVTRAIAKGVDEGWAHIELPENPFDDDPIYKLSYLDSEKFADAVAAIYPNVNWDETVAVEDLPGEQPAEKAEESK
jgi:hypothetical protein